MNKDELKEKGEHLKDRIKEAYGDAKKKAGEYIDRTREHGKDKADEVKQDVPRQTPQTPVEGEDE
jgi:vacuolar-type H+-ATPase subunit H